jgi:NAD(P)-dependent dehydrogenase (short-subunit alcohol dehydrogenase family)
MSQGLLAIIGSGGMGLAIARRLGSGRRIILGDLNPDPATATLVSEGHAVSAIRVDVTSLSSVQAMAALGPFETIIHTAGVSPAMATTAQIYEVDLVGTAHVIEAFYPFVAEGGSLVCISSMAGHLTNLAPELERHLASATAAELVLDIFPTEPGQAYCLAKRGNILRVQASAKRYGEKGARINSVSPGIVRTPMGELELQGERGRVVMGMVGLSACKRVGTPGDVAGVVAFLCGQDASYITGNDVLVDGGMIAGQVWKKGVFEGK